MTILVVEDNKVIRTNLIQELHLCIPNADIHGVETHDEAIARAQDLKHSHVRLNASVIDLRIPVHHANQTAIVTSVCQEIDRIHPNGLIVHITTYESERDVSEHLTKYHLDPRAKEVSPFISKLQDRDKTPWERRVAQAILRHEIIGPLRLAFDQDASTGRGGTHRISSLAADIAAYWESLDSDTRREIQKYFTVEVLQKEGGPEVLVGLGGESE